MSFCINGYRGSSRSQSKAVHYLNVAASLSVLLSPHPPPSHAHLCKQTSLLSTALFWVLTTGCVTTQKSEVLSHSVEEAWNHANYYTNFFALNCGNYVNCGQWCDQSDDRLLAWDAVYLVFNCCKRREMRNMSQTVRRYISQDLVWNGLFHCNRTIVVPVTCQRSLEAGD
jgi:hypothetical protein